MTETLDVDLLVFGAGMAGLTAAAFAAEAGLRVLVVEKSPDIGGSALLSGGKLWTAKSWELMEQETPGGDSALKRVAFDLHRRAADWLKHSGVTVNEPTPHLHYGMGHDFDIEGYLRWCAAMVTGSGGFIIRSATVDHLDVEDGRVVGAVISEADGDTRVRAPHTLMATGGFGGSPALLECFVAAQGANTLPRCNPANTGDGIRLGLGAGAALSPSMKGFYGHVMQSPVHKFGPREFRYYTHGTASVSGIILNRDGKRFCDESLEDHQNAQRILEQPGARGLLLFDKAIREQVKLTKWPDDLGPTDVFEVARSEGGRAVSADSWEELFAKTAEWGFDASQALATVDDFNRRAAQGGDGLSPPRRRGLRPLDQGPFFAVEGQTGVTATHGGLRVDPEGRVLDSFGKPIPGLHAAGADAGNMHGEGYVGGLNFAATFGLLAADHAIATFNAA